MNRIQYGLAVFAVCGLLAGGTANVALAGNAHVKEVIAHAKEGVAHAKEAIMHLEEAVKSSVDTHAKEAVKHAEESLAHAEQAEKPAKAKKKSK